MKSNQRKEHKVGTGGVDHLKIRNTFFNKEESNGQEIQMKTESEVRKTSKTHVSKYQKR
jgi:hypothetical protein